MKCAKAKSLFSSNLDGTLSGLQMRALEEHFETCAACWREYSWLVKSHGLLTSLPRPQVPADLALRLRVAVSQQLAQQRYPWLEGALLRLENATRMLVLPATAGLATAVIIFGVLMGIFALQAQLRASSDDVPLLLYSAPELQASAYNMTQGMINEDSLIVEAYIDPNGRVEGYKVLSTSRDAQKLLPEVKNVLIFTQFRPAMAMGRATEGRAVLSFSRSQLTRIKG